MDVQLDWSNLAAAAAIIILILRAEKRRDQRHTTSEGQFQSPLLQITTSILYDTMLLSHFSRVRLYVTP